MEVLVSVAILAVGVTVLLECIINSLDANRLTQEYSRAIFLAETKLWEMERKYAWQIDQDTGESSDHFDAPFQDYSWRTEGESEDSAVEYRIKVTVLWMHRGKEMDYSLDLLVPMRRDERDLK
jgi:hypothetical protein